MAKRGTVTDYAGNELHADDLIAYSSRRGNQTRLADATIIQVSTRLVAVPDVGRIVVPVLHIQPTGMESGFTKRRSLRAEWITASAVRRIEF